MKRVPLTRGYVALVDDSDFETVMFHRPWYVMVKRKTTYAARGGGRNPIVYMHTMLLGLPPNNRQVEIDHRDGNGLNNQRSNIRFASRSQNRMNTSRRIDNTSGVKGVTQRGQKWIAQIQYKKQNHYLGIFSSKVVAALAYKHAAEKLHKEFARW